MRYAIAAAILAIAAGAGADPDVAPEKLEQAKARFERGKAKYEAHDYKTAIDEYLAAYRIAPFPELVFNIGQAFRLAGKDARALEAYQMFLKQQPTGDLAAEADGHVLALRNKGVEPSEELRTTKPSDGYDKLEQLIKERAAHEAASLMHRRQRFFIGGDLTAYGLSGGLDGNQISVAGGLYHRLSSRAALQPRVLLGVIAGSGPLDGGVENAPTTVQLEAQGRLLAYPTRWFFLGGGIGLGLSTCKALVRNGPLETCEGGAYASSFVELGLLVAERYEVSLQLHPGWILEEADVIDGSRVDPGIGFTFSYHL